MSEPARIAAPFDPNLLRAGERVLLSGRIFTARDRAHRWLLERDFKPLHGAIVFHCGPIISRGAVIAAGPTTSERMASYTAGLIERYAVPAIIGKGGMGARALEAMRGRCVYLAAVGGAGLLYAERLRLVRCHTPEFGMAEAIWELEAKDLPLIVAMDAHGRSIYEEVARKSQQSRERLK